MKIMKMMSLLVVLFIATVLLLPMAAGAATSDRTLPTSSVNPGEQFTVSMTVADGAPGKVVETLPPGFTYVDSTIDSAQVLVDAGNNTVTFVFISDVASFSYDVTASSTADTYDFSGFVKGPDLVESAVGGDTSIVVEAESSDSTSASAERTLPTTSVNPGAQFTVSMTVADGAPGKVVETLPPGFTYVDSTIDSAQVLVDTDNNTVTFVFISDVASFSYDVTASSTADTYDFSGFVKGPDLVESAVGGASSIVVEAELSDSTSASAERTLPTTSVEPDAQFTVSMTVADGAPGKVVETLPSGFTYVDSTIDAAQVLVDTGNNTVTFVFISDVASFSYDVTASSTADTYDFSGFVKGPDLVESAVGGDTSINVATPVIVNDLPLDAGWNFISVPHKLENSSKDNVLTGVAYDAVYYYDADVRLWEDVSTFEPFKGYWINVSETDQVILEESLAAKQTIDRSLPASVQLYEGWNSVGSNYESVESAEKVLMSVDESYLKIADKYGVIGLNGEYEANDDGTESFMMNPYEGYWVLITQNAELT